MSDKGVLTGARRTDRRRGMSVRAEWGRGVPSDWPPALEGWWVVVGRRESSVVTRGPHVTRSCRKTQPSVQSSLASGYQLPAALRSVGWHPARGKQSRTVVRCGTICGE
ncbi:uncharacterized protein LOC144581251 [Callithrix jacchus]